MEKKKLRCSSNKFDTSKLFQQILGISKF